MPFSEASFGFFSDLSENNDRDWFNAHKKTFKAEVEAPFIDLLEALSNRLEDSPRPLTGGKQTTFRLNRDVRFSEDKSPYKTNMSGLLTPTGTKSEMAGIVYLHLEADGGFAVAGFYNLSPKQLAPMRDDMIARAEKFDQVLQALEASGRNLDRSMSLSSMPKGFTEHADHRHADVIKLKSLMVREDLPTDLWLSGDVIDRVEALARDCMPLLRFSEPARD
ncbi:MAG: DUF2461 domain-containing protein [Roseicyclus sp.]|nr:DUF2461 domain-containing protein [Roseicyclus sp.]